MNKLTKKSKTLIIVTSVISALLIITAAVWYIAAGGTGAQGRGGMFILLIIVLIAVIATAGLIYARLKRNEYTKELNPEYFEAYEAVQDSVSNSNLTISERKEVLSDVTGMLYYAQKEGRSAKEAIGDDIEGFVDKVKASFGYRNGAVFYIINGLMYLIMILSLTQAVNFYMHEEVKNFFDAKMGISIIPYMVALSFLVVPLMRRSIAKMKMGWAFFIPLIFVVVYIGLNEILYRTNPDIAWIDAYLNGEAGFITSWWALAAYAAAEGLGFLAKWFMRKKSLKKL